MAPPADPRRLATILAGAARALHGESDGSRAFGWFLGAVAELCRTPDVAVCVFERDTSPTWHVNRLGRVDLTALGDPRAHHRLGPCFQRLECVSVPDPSGHGLLVDADTLLAVPVHDEGTLRGLMVAAVAEDDADDDMLSAVTALCAHLSVAIENRAAAAHVAELRARGEEVVHRLQEAVRPPAPVVANAELGVEYVAADPRSPTGGDLYDWSTLPDGDLHLAVVDVMGKGVEATQHALALTHALRLLALEGCPLEDLVARCDSLVTAQNPELVATLMVARYRPDTGSVLLAGAGHPPAILVHEGRAREIAAPGIPVGWPGAGSSEVVQLRLERSDTLVLYTDGLIEATKDILAGLDNLARAAEVVASYPATSMARALVDRQLAEAVRRDDSLALVLRRRLPPERPARHVLAPLTHRFAPSLAAVPVARHLLQDWLERIPLEPDVVDTLLLVASELLSNAVRHAGAESNTITLRAAAEGDAVALEVSDQAGTLAWPDRLTEVPDPELERGRGLFLVSELTDELTSFVDAAGATVRAVKRAVLPERAHSAATAD